MRQEHRFFISATENVFQFSLNLCLICAQAVNPFENALTAYQNKTSIYGVPLKILWILKLLLFVGKAFLSMFGTYKALADNIVLQSKIRHKRECNWSVLFLKLFNTTLLVLSLTAGLVFAFLSDTVGRVLRNI